MKEIQKYDGNQVVSWDKCDWKPKEVAAPAKVLKLSEAIRVGHSMIKESRDCYLNDGCGCALGAALVTRGHRSQDEPGLNGGYDVVRNISQNFNVPMETVRDISTRHFTGAMNRLQLADWLEKQGY